jgi:hypothetical protein
MKPTVSRRRMLAGTAAAMAGATTALGTALERSCVRRH